MSAKDQFIKINPRTRFVFFGVKTNHTIKFLPEICKKLPMFYPFVNLNNEKNKSLNCRVCVTFKIKIMRLRSFSGLKNGKYKERK